MKLILKKSQHEVFVRLCALRRTCDYLNDKCHLDENCTQDSSQWSEFMEKYSECILDIAYSIGGLPMIMAIKSDLDKNGRY